MLILSRKAQQAIHIGNDVRVTVIATGKGSVRIGVDAPDDVVILRDEIWQTRAGFQVDAAEASVSEADASEGAASEKWPATTEEQSEVANRQEVLPFFDQ